MAFMKKLISVVAVLPEAAFYFFRGLLQIGLALVIQLGCKLVAKMQGNGFTNDITPICSVDAPSHDSINLPTHCFGNSNFQLYIEVGSHCGPLSPTSDVPKKSQKNCNKVLTP